MGEIRYPNFYNQNGHHPENSEANNPPDMIKKYWEDDLLRFAIKPFLKKISQQKKQHQQKVRILELGSSQGVGYEILTSIPQKNSQWNTYPSYILNEDHLGLYLGLDPIYENIENANHFYRDKPRVRFLKGDFNKGLGILKEAEAPFDVYFSTHGILSSLSVTQLKYLLKDVCEHSANESLLILDFLGKEALIKNHSYHEECAWTLKPMIALLEEVQAETGFGLELLKTFDRSLLMTHSSENRYYGNFLKDIRPHLNSLLTPYQRTDLRKLIINPEILPLPDNARMESNLQHLISCWNLFLEYATHRFHQAIKPQDLQDWALFPSVLQFGLLTLDRLLKDIQWVAYGDPRANIVEPHIAYVLRSFEYELQKGLGCGQYFTVFLRVKK
jgi:hypothetical protein